MSPTPNAEDRSDSLAPVPGRDAVVAAIRQAGRTAGSELEVYRSALAAVAPLVDADFASVFLRDPDDPALLRLACAQNWPQSSARFLGDIRIREGRGPTGLALGEARIVEVPDVFDDPALEEWWEPARELGFVAMAAHPLMSEGRPVGVVSFYFSAPEPLNAENRALLELAAREMARAARTVESG